MSECVMMIAELLTGWQCYPLLTNAHLVHLKMMGNSVLNLFTKSKSEMMILSERKMHCACKLTVNVVTCQLEPIQHRKRIIFISQYYLKSLKRNRTISSWKLQIAKKCQHVHRNVAVGIPSDGIRYFSLNIFHPYKQFL